ncbi:MAG: MFS transporter [Gammaproteobacteria bacterium]|nr:MFS transporter [Gammaproteobacteria bacterium]
MSTLAPAAAPVPWRDDARVVGVVAFAHLVSHFFQLVLPPMFPWLREAFALSYVELGFIMSVLFSVSGLGQAAAGFVVDRYGALPTLVAGLGALAGGAVVAASASGYAGLLGAAVLFGLGNAVFHPVDFWLINHRVSVPRLGPAFSVHGLSGSLGWAAAPVFMLAVATPFGWRAALLAAAALPLVAMAGAWWARGVLGRVAATPAAASASPAPAPALAFLRLRAVWLCFGFFACVAAALGGVQGFSPTVFERSYGLALGPAAMSVTFYMLASGAGMLVGGWLVTRSRVLERNITVALLLAVAAALLVASGWPAASLALALMAVMGFGSGLSGPSRDLLIRAAAPPGATGRVYGVVYSGLDVGIAVGPPLLGRMLDHGIVGGIYYVVAACLFAGVVLARGVAAHTRAVA